MTWSISKSALWVRHCTFLGCCLPSKGAHHLRCESLWVFREPRPTKSRPRDLSFIVPQVRDDGGSAARSTNHQSPITFHLSSFIFHLSPPRRSTQSTRKEANSGLEEKHSPNPSPVQNPKPSPNARPLMTQASVRFFLTCAVAS
jgi:hypothetical protein